MYLIDGGQQAINYHTGVPRNANKTHQPAIETRQAQPFMDLCDTKPPMFRSDSRLRVQRVPQECLQQVQFEGDTDSLSVTHIFESLLSITSKRVFCLVDQSI